jgi:hypothetical protein
MTQATLTPPPVTVTTRDPSIATSFTRPQAERGSFLDRARKDPWILPKLCFLALVATPQMYAIATVAASESRGILIAVVPDMLATIVVAWGMIGCLLFLGEGEGEHA